MKKLKLDDLAVESFETQDAPKAGGTVLGNDDTDGCYYSHGPGKGTCPTQNANYTCPGMNTCVGFNTCDGSCMWTDCVAVQTCGGDTTTGGSQLTSTCEGETCTAGCPVEPT